MPNCRLPIGLIGAIFALLLSAPSDASLTIQVQSSVPIYDNPFAFELFVIIQNRGSFPLVVLPQALRREYSPVGSGSAEYSPYPGPAMAPWKGAFSLQPGQARTLTFTGMRDGDGSWRIGPGRYELRVRLSVTPDVVEASRSQLENLEGAIWQGDIQSSNIRVTYSPAPAAS